MAEHIISKKNKNGRENNQKLNGGINPPLVKWKLLSDECGWVHYVPEHKVHYCTNRQWFHQNQSSFRTPQQSANRFGWLAAVESTEDLQPPVEPVLFPFFPFFLPPCFWCIANYTIKRQKKQKKFKEAQFWGVNFLIWLRFWFFSSVHNKTPSFVIKFFFIFYHKRGVCLTGWA